MTIVDNVKNYFMKMGLFLYMSFETSAADSRYTVLRKSDHYRIGCERFILNLSMYHFICK